MQVANIVAHYHSSMLNLSILIFATRLWYPVPTAILCRGLSTKNCKVVHVKLVSQRLLESGQTAMRKSQTRKFS